MSIKIAQPPGLSQAIGVIRDALIALSEGETTPEQWLESDGPRCQNALAWINALTMALRRGEPAT